MPRETVVSSVPPYHVKVGWNRDVQIGVESERAQSLFWMLLEVQDPIITDDKTEDEARRIRARHSKRLAELGSYLRAAIGTATGRDIVLPTPDPSFDEGLARSVLNTLDVHAQHNITGLWSHLDRKGVNDVIRILRKARDRAYGRDE